MVRRNMSRSYYMVGGEESDIGCDLYRVRTRTPERLDHKVPTVDI